MSGPAQTRPILTVKKSSPPSPVAAALMNATSHPAAPPFDELPSAPLSVAALLVGGRVPALGYFLGSPATPADTAMSTDPVHEESTDAVRPE